MVVMEGTGGYEYLLLRCLASHKLDASVINPRRVRDFAKGIGLDAKTDPIDARVISRYAEVVMPKPMGTAADYAQQRGRSLMRFLGDGNDGAAWESDQQTAIKALERRDSYVRERDAYLRLQERSIVDIQASPFLSLSISMIPESARRTPKSRHFLFRCKTRQHSVR